VDRRPLHVVLVGPPLSASGGIGRVMSYALAALSREDLELEVLDTRGFSSRPLYSLLPLLRSCGRLLLLAARGDVDVAHINISSHGSALRKGVVVRACRLARVPVVLHLHASSFPEFFAPLPGWAQRWVRRTFALSRRVIVLSETWRAYAQDALAVPPEQTTVLPNAAPSTLSPAPARSPEQELRILFLGRLGPRKGLPELLSALGDPRLRDHAWRATVAGDGDVETYRARATELGLDQRMTFPGWVSASAVHALLLDAHVLVLPSHAEGLPMSVLEAFAAGLPVICTPVGGLAEVVVHEFNGLLVRPGDVAALVDAVGRLITDEPLRARLAVGARDTWRDKHSIEQYSRRLAAEWRLAAGHSRVGPEVPGNRPPPQSRVCRDRWGAGLPHGGRLDHG
jgi:glycosyltransferase involved in cell wall biosynthesis